MYAALLPAIASLCTAAAVAESYTGNATVTILAMLQANEDKTVQFGAIQAVNGSCTLDAGGNLSGSGGNDCAGTGQLGEFTIAGTQDQGVAISVSPDSGPSGLSFAPVLYSASTASLTGGETTAQVGGALLLSDPSPGQYNLTYTLNINYN